MVTDTESQSSSKDSGIITEENGDGRDTAALIWLSISPEELWAQRYHGNFALHLTSSVENLEGIYFVITNERGTSIYHPLYCP